MLYFGKFQQPDFMVKVRRRVKVGEPHDTNHINLLCYNQVTVIRRIHAIKHLRSSVITESRPSFRTYWHETTQLLNSMLTELKHVFFYKNYSLQLRRQSLLFGQIIIVLYRNGDYSIHGWLWKLISHSRFKKLYVNIIVQS